ncbi:MAG: tetratricopeptide repeat protein [Deltaproteobacteria bacterium]|nr:tetratricopeptide repeat protein [Deltaproteobacteria bacterium]
MKPIFKSITLLASVMTVIMLGTNLCDGQVTSGQIAQVFSLKDVKGMTHDLSQMKERPMVILYFFDADSRPSQEGLLSLDQLAKRYDDADLIVWGITLSSTEKVASFLTKTSPSLPILLDKSGVSDLYQARLIIPTVCILGPKLMVLDHFQGGGKTTEIMLLRLAERTLQRKQTVLAKAISDEVSKKNPKNLKAKTIKGYAALKEGNLNEAEETFHELAKKKGQGEVLGKEGLTAVYARKGQTEKALKLAKEVEQEAPDRAYVHVVKGDILFSQNKKKEAEAEYRKAVQKKEGEPFQKAIARNQFGRFQASQGKYQEARELYDQAVDLDPYYIEATSNKGVTYEKEGKWNDALETYRQALSLDKNDTFAAVLAKKAQGMLALQKDIAQKKRIDKLVQELAARYRGQKKSWTKKKDTWTSRPMVLSFVDFQEKGGLAERDGLSMVLTTQLSDQLNASGRVQVVERVLIERLLEELNLGSSDLADPETALQLGKVLAAKVISTGSLFYLPDATLLSLRLIDTETSAIPKVITRQLDSQTFLEKELNRLNREILKTIILKYPLQGYVVQTTGDEVIINLGSKQGVVLGTKFEVIEEQKPIKYKGKLLRSAPKAVGEIEVVRVEPDLCYTRILNQERALRADDKVREKIEDLVAMGKSDVIL